MDSGGGRRVGEQSLTGGRWAVRLGAVAAFAFLIATLLPAWLDGSGIPGGAALRVAFHPLCHQLPSRSLTSMGLSPAVCARCEGLYLGGALALLFAALRRETPRVPAGLRWLALAAAPTALDALVVLSGGAGLPSAPRFLISLPAGFAAGLYLAAGLADLGGHRWTNDRPICSGPR